MRIALPWRLQEQPELDLDVLHKHAPGALEPLHARLELGADGRTGAQHLATGSGTDDLAELVDGEVLDAATQVLDLVRRAHRVDDPETQPDRGQQLHVVTGAGGFGAVDQVVRQRYLPDAGSARD